MRAELLLQHAQRQVGERGVSQDDRVELAGAQRAFARVDAVGPRPAIQADALASHTVPGSGDGHLVLRGELELLLDIAHLPRLQPVAHIFAADTHALNDEHATRALWLRLQWRERQVEALLVNSIGQIRPFLGGCADGQPF